MIANSDWIPDPFPGIVSGAGTTGAPGTRPGRAMDDSVRSLDGSESGLPGVGTPMDLPDQAGWGHSVSTVQPGQMTGFSPSAGERYDYTDSGAGQGRAVIDSSERYPWQAKAGD